MSGIAAMCYFSHRLPSPPPPPSEGCNFAPRPHLFSYRTPHPLTEGVNFAVGPHPNWPVMSGHTSAGKPPSMSDCRLYVQLASWGLCHHSSAGSEEQIHFSQQSPKMLKMASESHALLLFLGLITTTQTLLHGRLTVTLIPTLRPTSTLAPLRQRLYRTSEAPLKLLHVYYNLTIYELHTN